MKESVYKSYDELPLFLNAETVAKLLGISPSSGYELMHEKEFPVFRIGNRMVVPKEKFRKWVEENTGKLVWLWSITAIRNGMRLKIIFLCRMKFLI